MPENGFKIAKIVSKYGKIFQERIKKNDGNTRKSRIIVVFQKRKERDSNVIHFRIKIAYLLYFYSGV